MEHRLQVSKTGMRFVFALNISKQHGGLNIDPLIEHRDYEVTALYT